MRHVPDSNLRRLVDEPFAVADAATDHLAGCRRCRARSEQIAGDAAAVATLLSRPQLVPDVDSAWRRLHGASTTRRAAGQPGRGFTLSRPGQSRVALMPIHSKVALAALAALVAGTAATAALLTISAPAKVPPGQSSSGSVTELADFVGLDGSGVAGGFGTPSGSLRLPFGTVQWTSTSRAYRVGSIGQANRATGLNLRLPPVVPSGVGQPYSFAVQPEVTATVSFSAAAGRGLNGTSLTISAGPATLVEYHNSASSIDLPTLLIAAINRPRATSTRATSAQLETFVLSRPGLPAAFVQEIRLLVDLGNLAELHLPPSLGVGVSATEVDGAPGALVTAEAGAASAVIWEDGGVVHVVAGLLDKEDVVDVANQLG